VPWHISKRGSQWCVILDTTGESEGCHDTEAAAKRQMAALYANEANMATLPTESIKHVEILREGEWLSANAGKVPVTTADLDDIVKAYRGTKSILDVPVKLGHEALQEVAADLIGLADAEPSFGWIENIRREGGSLYADMTDVPAKLAAFLRARTWRNRSAEIHYGYPVGGKRWRRIITAVSLLGAVPPAVEGMADMFSAGDAGEVRVVQFMAGDDNIEFAGEDTSELEAIIADFRALRERAEVYLAKRKGAPRVRHLFEAFESDLRKTARANLTKETEMDDEQEGTGPVELQAGDPGAVPGFANADQFVAWLAGKLDVAPGDLDALAAKVKEAMGMGVPPEEGEVPVEAPPGFTAAKEDTETLTKLARAEGDLAMLRAEAEVEAALRAGRAIPAQRDTLVRLLAAGDRAAFESLTGSTLVKLSSEKGTVGGQDEVLTADEIAVAKDMGYDLETLRRAKRGD